MPPSYRDVASGLPQQPLDASQYRLRRGDKGVHVRSEGEEDDRVADGAVGGGASEYRHRAGKSLASRRHREAELPPASRDAAADADGGLAARAGTPLGV